MTLVCNFHNPTSWYALRGGYAIVPWDNSGSKPLIEGLRQLSVAERTAQNADAFGKRNKFG